MKGTAVFSKISEHIKEIIYSHDYKQRSRKRETDFTRNRKMNFSDYIIFMLKCSKRSLQAGLNEFCRQVKMYKTEYSKQAFSKGRERIRPEAIRELFEETVTEFYKSANYKTLKGYRVSAIDGTDYNLPCNEKLLEEFGSENYAGNIIHVQALGSCLYDVLNHYMIDASIGRYDGNERIHAKEHLQKLLQFRTDKELVLFDRGYPSEELMHFMDENNIKYLMRCTKNNFFREIRDFNGTDGVVVRSNCKGEAMAIRVLCYNNNDTTLITNLTSDEFNAQELYDLYHKRWSVETQYNDIKNKMKIEMFSGLSVTAIYQDFWTTMTLSNLISALEFDAMIAYESKTTNHSAFREKKVNHATLINSLKDEFFSVFLQNSKRKQNKILSHIIIEISKSLVCIVPDRHFPRNISHSQKFLPNNSKSLS